MRKLSINGVVEPFGEVSRKFHYGRAYYHINPNMTIGCSVAHYTVVSYVLILRHIILSPNSIEHNREPHNSL